MAIGPLPNPLQARRKFTISLLWREALGTLYLIRTTAVSLLLTSKQALNFLWICGGSSFLGLSCWQHNRYPLRSTVMRCVSAHGASCHYHRLGLSTSMRSQDIKSFPVWLHQPTPTESPNSHPFLVLGGISSLRLIFSDWGSPELFPKTIPDTHHLIILHRKSHWDDCTSFDRVIESVLFALTLQAYSISRC